MLMLALHDDVSLALAGAPERIRAALADKANALAADLQAKIQQNLSGAVLNRKSGVLAGAIATAVDETDTDVSVTIAVSPDIKYAAIHEYGGTIPPHEIVPDKAKALAFLVGGKHAFAARVNLPAIAMPERSYMRSALAGMAEKIETDLSAAVADALD